MSNYHPYKQPHTAYLRFCGKWLFKDKADSRIRTDNLSLKAITLPLSYAGKCAPYKLPISVTENLFYFQRTIRYRPTTAITVASYPSRIKFSTVALAGICNRHSVEHRLSRPFLRKGYGLSFTYWIGGIRTHTSAPLTAFPYLQTTLQHILSVTIQCPLYVCKDCAGF